MTETDIVQLQLQPKVRGSHIGDHVEVHHKWCPKHNISYNCNRTKTPAEVRHGRKNSECYLCFRERVQIKNRGSDHTKEKE